MNFKKISAAVLAVCLVLSCFTAAAAGVTDCEVSMVAASGITIAKNAAQYSNGYLYSSFDVKNISDADMTVNVVAEAYNAGGSMVARTSFTRLISPDEEVPVKLCSSRLITDDEVSVSVCVTKEELSDVFYFAPDGNDENEGTYNSPKATISEIPVLLSELNADAAYADADIIIVLKGGLYDVSEAVSFGEYSSLGSVKLTTDGTEVKLVAGLQLKGSDFLPVTNADVLSYFPESVHGKLYYVNLLNHGVTTLSDTFKNGNSKANDPLRTQLYYNGESTNMAQAPNEGFFTAQTAEMEGSTATFTSTDIKAWTNTEEAWVRGWFAYDWDLNMGRVTFDATTGTGTFARFLKGFSAHSVSTTNKPWFIYNLPAELDIENEYVVYSNNLYYYPSEADVASGAFSDADIYLNTDANNMLEFTGTSNFTLENLVFENSKGAFVSAASVQDFEILGCDFKNSGADAVNVSGNNNRVYGCNFYNIGANGVTMSGGDRSTLTPSGSIIENCLFEHVSQISRTNAGPVTLGGCGVTVKNNTFKDVPHRAISFSGNDHVIEYNDFSQILTDGSTDAGIIYSGRNITTQGNMVQYNYFHDTNSGMSAIYWDDFQSGNDVENNVFDSIGGGEGTAIFFHAGVANEFNDNIVINAARGIRIRGKGTLSDGYVTEWNYQKTIDAGETPYTLTSYLADVPWEGELWQERYGDVLKYVDNKTTRVATDNVSTNNVFVNVADEIYAYDAGQTEADVIQSGNQMVTEMDADTLARYNSIKGGAGIYTDGVYRK